VNASRVCSVALLTCALARGDNIEDLGVITPRRSIVLERCATRNDFMHFVIELRQGTNLLFMVMTTNTVLTVDGVLDVVQDGRAVMGVKSICLDGAESPMAVYRFEVRREGPTAPVARAIGVIAPLPDFRLDDVLRDRKELEKPLPPPVPSAGEPAMMMMRPVMTTPPPLPHGTNESYSAYQKRLADVAESGKRRNQ
jgi:hypothetical protein